MGRALRGGSWYFDKKGLPYRKANVFTIGSLFHETTEFLHRLEKHNFNAIDLELSAFFSAAKSANIPSSAVCYVTDRPCQNNFIYGIPETDKKRLKIIRDTAVKTACSFIQEF